jgi:surfeit locus 1 family protein
VRWDFARRPKWIARHVAVAVLVVTMVLLGLWQLRRLDDKRDHKALVEARQEAPAAPVAEVVPAEGDVADALHRAVTAEGTYQDDDTVVVENRTLNGASGGWVLTPLLLDGEDIAVVVNRGFIGFDRDGEIVPPPAPQGRVEVEGLVQPTQSRGRIGPQDPDEGRLDVLARVDVARLAEQVDYELLPAYVQLVASDPPEPSAEPGAPALVALGRPSPEEGPHLSYAVQWFTFTAIALVGYAVLLRHVGRQRVDEEEPEVAREG